MCVLGLIPLPVPWPPQADRFGPDPSFRGLFGFLDHGETLGDLPDDVLSKLLPVAKKVALATGVPQYNIVQVCLLAASLTVRVVDIFF